jgi:FKBP-type peptidyl-prolyl cis-trans isomerase
MIKKDITLLLILFLLICLSCKKEEGEPEPRTLEQEMAELNNFLLKKEADGYDVDTTDIGVFYIVRKEGEGPFPEAGDTCYISYRGYFMSGKLFETSNDYHPNGIWKLIYEEADMIQGLQDGIGHMNKDSNFDIIIPSHLAYGNNGAGIIPPYNTLIYVTNMIDITPAKD